MIAALGLMLAFSQGREVNADPSVTRGRLMFLRCASCHAISRESSAKIGPTLMDVYGRKAGSSPGYNYSPAMKQADFMWDDSTLNRWLKNPNELVPGTSMAFAGLPNSADREAVIAYLRNPTP